MSIDRLIAAGGGLGFVRFAPGTVASAAALPVGVALLLASPWLLLAASVVVAIGGVWAIRAAAIDGDPGWVVIDEIAGQWIALLGLVTISPVWVGAAFVLFRIFDIAKPGLVGWADRRHDAVGIMLDDAIAGAMAAAILWVAHLAMQALAG